MITVNETDFPYNIVGAIADELATIDDEIFVIRRPLRESDPVQSIGVFGVQWMPDEESLEMRGGFPGPSQPTLSQYIISIQIVVKDADEVRGAATHGTLAKIVRTMLYRNEALRVALHQLSSTTAGSTERTQRFGVRTQRYLSNELQGSWLYMSTIEFWLETETT